MTTTEEVYIALDIGTTSVSLAVTGADGQVRECRNVRSDSEIIADKAFHKTQSVEVIMSKAMSLIGAAVGKYANIAAIGLTGQMHGILYVDADGRAVSDLYTWQDKSGDELANGDRETYCNEIERLTGEKVAAGYGLVTHYYLAQNNRVPENAHKICTIMDYAGMILTKRKSPLTHLSNVASLGLFSCGTSDFNRDALAVLNIDEAILPDITGGNDILGYHGNIPVAVAIGDNQASFIGTVDRTGDSISVNIGTGSQVSMISNGGELCDGFELRPFINGAYLMSYSALCGGYAYAILQRFVRDIVRRATGVDEEQYALMDLIAEESAGGGLQVDTAFNGTRLSPEVRGSISNISADNFTLANLIHGFSEGIVNELYEKCAQTDEMKTARFVTVSGNGARKNKLIPKIVAEKFGLDVVMKDVEEEAAVGAANFAAECEKNGEVRLD